MLDGRLTTSLSQTTPILANKKGRVFPASPSYSDDVFTFTTADSVSPKIVETSPANGAAGVALNVLSSSGDSISVTFDEAVDTDSVKRSKLVLSDLTVGSNWNVSFDLATNSSLEVTFSNDKKKMTVKLKAGEADQLLVEGHRYQVKLVSTQATDT